jgi:hypothetical protein
MENNKTFTLTNGGKTSYFDCHHISCQYITSTERIERIFLLVELKRILHPRIFLVKNYMTWCEYGDIVFGFQSRKQKFSGFGLTHN